jgi:hypothetical protein
MFSDRVVTHKVKLVWLHLIDWLLVVITFRYSGVLILLLGLGLLRVWAITYEMHELSTIVAKVGRKFLGPQNSLLILLGGANLLSLSFF